MYIDAAGKTRRVTAAIRSAAEERRVDQIKELDKPTRQLSKFDADCTVSQALEW